MDLLRDVALAAILAYDQGRLGPEQINALRRALAPKPPPYVPPRPPPVPPAPPAPPPRPPPRPPVAHSGPRRCFLCGTGQGHLTPMGPNVWVCFGELCDVPY